MKKQSIFGRLIRGFNEEILNAQDKLRYTINFLKKIKELFSGFENGYVGINEMEYHYEKNFKDECKDNYIDFNPFAEKNKSTDCGIKYIINLFKNSKIKFPNDMLDEEEFIQNFFEFIKTIWYKYTLYTLNIYDNLMLLIKTINSVTRENYAILLDEPKDIDMSSTKYYYRNDEEGKNLREKWYVCGRGIRNVIGKHDKNISRILFMNTISTYDDNIDMTSYLNFMQQYFPETFKDNNNNDKIENKNGGYHTKYLKYKSKYLELRSKSNII